MSIYTLRPYQEDVVNRIIKHFKENQRVSILSCAPTGTGKSVLIGAVINELLEMNIVPVLMVNRKTLVEQLTETMKKSGHEVFQVWAESMKGQVKFRRQIGLDFTTKQKIYVCSLQTIEYNHYKDYLLTRLDYLIGTGKKICFVFDEAHETAFASISKDILNKYPDASCFGLTATPWASNEERNLARIFPTWESLPGYTYFINNIEESIVAEYHKHGYNIKHMGALTPYQIFTASPITQVDLSNAPLKKNEYGTLDYDDNYTSNIMCTPEMIEKSYNAWIEREQGKAQTMFFCVNIQHAKKMAEYIAKKGHTVATVLGNQYDTALYTKDNIIVQERKKIFDMVHSGELQVLVTCKALTTGVDLPCMSCCVILFGCLDLKVFFQIIGRVLRPCPQTGKTIATIICLDKSMKKLPTPHEITEYTPTQPKNKSENSSEEETTVIYDEEKEKFVCDRCGFIKMVRVGKPKPVTCSNCNAQLRKIMLLVGKHDIWDSTKKSMALKYKRKIEERKDEKHEIIYSDCLKELCNDMRYPPFIAELILQVSSPSMHNSLNRKKNAVSQKNDTSVRNLLFPTYTGSMYDIVDRLIMDGVKFKNIKPDFKYNIALFLNDLDRISKYQDVEKDLYTHVLNKLHENCLT